MINRMAPWLLSALALGGIAQAADDCNGNICVPNVLLNESDPLISIEWVESALGRGKCVTDVNTGIEDCCQPCDPCGADIEVTNNHPPGTLVMVYDLAYGQSPGTAAEQTPVRPGDSTTQHIKNDCGVLGPSTNESRIEVHVTINNVTSSVGAALVRCVCD